jgi:hypothetical protein
VGQNAPAQGTVAVLNVFNLAETEVEREIRFHLSDIGLPEGLSVRATDAPCHQRDAQITLWARLPALGHQLISLEVNE